MKFFVLDVTFMSFHGYDHDEFDSLADAFKHISNELAEDPDERQFEIHADAPDGMNWINVDGRSFEISEEEEEEEEVA